MDAFLVTASQMPHADEDEHLLCDALAAVGLSARAAAWDDPRIDWGQAQVCVIRSTWNYMRHHAAFLAWTERCARVSTLMNPPSVVRWNSHKAYLLELGRAGLPIVPTRLVRVGERADLNQLAGDWDEIVIKPAISAGSLGTVKIARADFAAGQAHLDALRAASHDVLVQPFLSSVATTGERALVWIDGAFTHAVRKSPRFAGDSYHVSGAVPIAPDEASLAEAILAVVPRPLLYARVDLARDDNGRPRLMELELIEPALFLDGSPHALARFADAIGRLATDARRA